jgi:hypothetical protein
MSTAMRTRNLASQHGQRAMGHGPAYQDLEMEKQLECCRAAADLAGGRLFSV